MNDGFATVTTFGNSTEASLARNRLAEAGIRSFLADEETASMTANLHNPVGIRLLVPEQDVKRARAVLAETATSARSAPNHGAAQPARGKKERAKARRLQVLSPDGDRPLTDREMNAQRAFISALFGLALWPLEFYAAWLLLKVYFSNQWLGPTLGQRAIAAAVILTIFVCTLGLTLLLITEVL